MMVIDGEKAKKSPLPRKSRLKKPLKSKIS
jgi:hypothetical protein